MNEKESLAFLHTFNSKLFNETGEYSAILPLREDKKKELFHN